MFGFRVADYEAGELETILSAPEEVANRLAAWATENEVELIGCSVPAEPPEWRALLSLLGFSYVDTTLRATLPKLQANNYRAPRMPVRLATADDCAAVEEIGARAFRAGRYHADARFPRELADRRYRHWLAQALAKAGPTNRMYVAGPTGAPAAFVHVTLDEPESAYVTLMGADPSAQGTMAPVAVWIGTMQALKDAGVRRGESKLSAANPRMINLAAYAGWRVSDPRLLFHWHAPEAPHLIPLTKIGG